VELNIQEFSKLDNLKLVKQHAKDGTMPANLMQLSGIVSADGETWVDWEERSYAYEGFSEGLTDRLKEAESVLFSVWQMANLINGGEHIKAIMQKYREKYPKALIEELNF